MLAVGVEAFQKKRLGEMGDVGGSQTAGSVPSQLMPEHARSRMLMLELNG